MLTCVPCCCNHAVNHCRVEDTSKQICSRSACSCFCELPSHLVACRPARQLFVMSFASRLGSVLERTSASRNPRQRAGSVPNTSRSESAGPRFSAGAGSAAALDHSHPATADASPSVAALGRSSTTGSPIPGIGGTVHAVASSAAAAQPSDDQRLHESLLDRLTFECAGCGATGQSGSHCRICQFALPLKTPCPSCRKLARGFFCSSCGTRLPEALASPSKHQPANIKALAVDNAPDDAWRSVDAEWRRRWATRSASAS